MSKEIVWPLVSKSCTWLSFTAFWFILQDWGQWSECRPVCGSHRRRTRRRICLGDFGCYGSIYDAERCPPVECNGLRDPGDGVWSARSAASIKEYKDNGGFFVPATIEILVTTLFCVFICQVAFVALGVWIFWRREGRLARESAIQMWNLLELCRLLVAKASILAGLFQSYVNMNKNSNNTTNKCISFRKLKTCSQGRNPQGYEFDLKMRLNKILVSSNDRSVLLASKFPQLTCVILFHAY